MSHVTYLTGGSANQGTAYAHESWQRIERVMAHMNETCDTHLTLVCESGGSAD